MCVVSMVMDHFYDKWKTTPLAPSPVQWTPPWLTTQTFYPVIPAVSAAEVEEFRRLLDRAREYDKKHNEPDCEMAEKRKAIQDLADKLGIDVSFIDKA